MIALYDCDRMNVLYELQKISKINEKEWHRATKPFIFVLFGEFATSQRRV
jgi:hypothetical protein